SDLNRDLINLYHAVRDFPEEIYGELNKIPRERETYNKIREAIISSDNLFERAVFTLYLNRNCFNGLYRTNKSGHFNVPFAAAGRGGYPSLSDFISASNQLKMANIICSDFEIVIKERLNKEDFVYLDPPYIKNEGRIFNEYVKGHFNKGDMDRLSDVLNLINSRGAYFLLSFIDDEAVYSLAEQWGAERYMVQKNISGFAASRRKSSEVIIKNW
ncbi:DNA adenine methylase, partial [Hoeflea olei]|uniref:DNA adenine methylase n=1 Tax=Hoeflea olei TaxID=1480615 RepID=UPI001112A50A